MWDRAENQITLVLIRHGATKANMEHRYLGKTDEVLSKEGEMQLFEYKKRGFFPNIDYLFSSPMKRCVQTAEILFPELKPVEIEEWKEIGVFSDVHRDPYSKERIIWNFRETNGITSGLTVMVHFLFRREKAEKSLFRDVTKAFEE